ncbi:META domain-containing protein [Novosphingobium lentum]|uniref:META domain-containing protein n=1 Tax=Novosphingobium lentum TaxID=145287 RepID=UPI0014707558|nr:META domain-containing protein [Novosphingobium lentum]
MTTRLAFLLLPGLALLGACASGVPNALALSGTQWRVVSIDGDAPAVPGKAKVEFHGTRIGANVGCNGMGGDFRVDGNRLIAGPLMATRMFCDGPVWGQEQAINALLAAAPQIERSGTTLRLDSGGHTVELQQVG